MGFLIWKIDLVFTLLLSTDRFGLARSEDQISEILLEIETCVTFRASKIRE